MRVLYLDDDIATRLAFKSWFDKTYFDNGELIAVDNLLDFHDLLFDSNEYFDKHILDIGLDKPNDISTEDYNEFLSSIGINAQADDIKFPLDGWRYINQVVRISEKTSNRLKSFLLITGYADYLRTVVSEEDIKDINMIGKGDENIIAHVKSFLNR